jgi:hypothetical protein
MSDLDKKKLNTVIKVIEEKKLSIAIAKELDLEDKPLELSIQKQNDICGGNDTEPSGNSSN